MKKIITLCMVGLAAVFASAKTLPDKTNEKQLNFRVLDAGQMAWNEEDGGGVLYLGSPTESKNLRIIDPTTIRGFRYKSITSELTVSASSNVVMETNQSYLYTCGQDTSPVLQDYELITKEETVKYDEKTGRQTKDYCTYDPNTGTYTHVTLPEGFVIDPTAGTDYYVCKDYHLVIFTIFAKDSVINELDFVYTEIQGAIGDFAEISTSRTITYDGQKAILEVKVWAGRPQDWFRVTNFTAKCAGIGDTVDFVNDVSTNGNLTVKIRDKEGTYNLNNLRYELYHKYDGNRGEHWSKYKAIANAEMGEHFIIFSSTNNHTKSAFGASGKSFVFQHCDNNYIKYIPGESDPSSPYAGTECRFTAINFPTAGSTVWTLDFILSNPVPANFIEVEYVDDLLKARAFWEPCEVTLTDVGGDQMNWHAEVPANYGTRKMGFWRIRLTFDALRNNLDVRATLRVLGENGKMYKLTFPTAGGTVTAVLDE